MLKRLLTFVVFLALVAAANAAVPLPERASGQKSAPIVFEVFTDFQCPGCAALYLNVLTKVIDEYCKTGKVYLIHREFPLNRPDHAHSREAARWAIACATVGKYEQVAQKLFQEQGLWGSTGNIEATLSQVLTPLEMKKVKQTMKDRANDIENAIAHDVFVGGTLPVKGTPSFRITTKDKVVYVESGTQPPPQYTLLKRFLDDQLKSVK